MTKVKTTRPPKVPAVLGKGRAARDRRPAIKDGGRTATAEQSREAEDPFALDPLGPPSGRPW